jgi:hypothetical protein
MSSQLMLCLLLSAFGEAITWPKHFLRASGGACGYGLHNLTAKHTLTGARDVADASFAEHVGKLFHTPLQANCSMFLETVVQGGLARPESGAIPTRRRPGPWSARLRELWFTM